MSVIIRSLFIGFLGINKQLLYYKIIEKINSDNFIIQFEIDNLILENITKQEIIKNTFLHPTKKCYIYKCMPLSDNIINKITVQFKNRSELKFYYPTIYNKISRGNKYKYILNNYENSFRKYSDEEFKQTSLKYKNKIDFINNDYNIYSSMKRLGLIDKYCSHMDNPLLYEYDRIIYAYEFPDNYVYIGLTKNIKQREYKRKADLNDAVNLHKQKTGLIPNFKELTDYIPSKEAQIKEEEFITIYKNNGWNILNRTSGGSLGGYKIKNK